MAKIGATFLLAYLIFGTMAGDWLKHGQATLGCGKNMLLAAAIFTLFFLVGVRATGRYNRFMGFSKWQWGIMPPLALAVGITLRFYAL
ncbi:MAG TPA: hypothetical protein VH370_19455 [Humisphaera sp.]|jgi:hypothetical protein|nr:hypothetical protein [Humisphaera sp.]